MSDIFLLLIIKCCSYGIREKEVYVYFHANILKLQSLFCTKLFFDSVGGIKK